MVASAPWRRALIFIMAFAQAVQVGRCGSSAPLFSRAGREPSEHDISCNVSLAVRVRTGALFRCGGETEKPIC